MTGGQALVQQLLRYGIDTIFGLPGIQLDFVFDALWEERDRIRVIHTRHEQATAYMADGFARSTGRIGTCLVVPRFSMMRSARFRSKVPGDARFIQIDIDPEEIGRNYPPNLGIAADAGQALGELCSRVSRHNRLRESRHDELSALARSSRERWAAASPLCDYGLAIRAELPEDGILVNESTQVGYWNAGGGFPVYQPRTFLGYGYQGTLGYGLPTALGAQIGNPDRKVISVNGDGGFLFNVQELATMAQHRIPVVAVVFDDRAYGNVWRIQQLRMGGHTIASELVNPDWIKLAESFGVAGYRAEDPAALREVLREALRSQAPALIAAPMPDATAISGFYPPEPLPPRPSLRRS